MKKKYFNKLLVVTFLIIGVCILYASLSNAGTISDNFDGASINGRLWRPFEESTQTPWHNKGAS